MTSFFRKFFFLAFKKKIELSKYSFVQMGLGGDEGHKQAGKVRKF